MNARLLFLVGTLAGVASSSRLIGQDVPDPGPEQVVGWFDGEMIYHEGTPPSGGVDGNDSGDNNVNSSGWGGAPPLPDHVHQGFWGHLRLDPGYEWGNADPNDYSVHPIPWGTPFGKSPHVIWGGDARVYPAPGWMWITGSKGKFGSKNKFQVEPIPFGTPYENWPHVVYAGDGEHLQTEDGYLFVSSDPAASHDYSVKLDPAGTREQQEEQRREQKRQAERYREQLQKEAKAMAAKVIQIIALKFAMDLTPVDNRANVSRNSIGDIPAPFVQSHRLDFMPAVILAASSKAGDLKESFQSAAAKVANDPRIGAAMRIVQKMSKDVLNDRLHALSKSFDPNVESKEAVLRVGKGEVQLANEVFDELRKVVNDLTTNGRISEEDIQKVDAMPREQMVSLLRQICNDPSLKVEEYRKDMESLFKGEESKN